MKPIRSASRASVSGAVVGARASHNAAESITATIATSQDENFNGERSTISTG